MPKHRLFVALPPSEEVKKKSEAIQKKYQHLKVRWLKPEYFHFTLLAPWYAQEEEFENLKIRVKEMARNFKPFQGKLLKILPGPDPSRPRLIWAEGGTPKEFIRLQAALEIGLKRAPEKRPPKLHLTLARRAGKMQIKIEEKINWEVHFSKIELWESHLKPGGAEYEVLASYEMGK